MKTDTQLAPKFATRYKNRLKVALSDFEPTLTKQASKDECDINLILRKHAEGNILVHVNSMQGQFGDFGDVADYQTSLDKVLRAQEAFASLPSKIRQRFDHDPAALLSFLENDSNRAEAIALGLVEDPNLELPTSSQSPSTPSSSKKDSADER